MSEYAIHRIVMIFRFIKDTGIIPQSFIPGIQSAKNIFQKNRNNLMLLLIINFINKVIRKIHRI